MSEEVRKRKWPEGVYGTDTVQEILIVLDWMFRLLHTNIQDVRNDIRWLADRLDRIEKDLMKLG